MKRYFQDSWCYANQETDRTQKNRPECGFGTLGTGRTQRVTPDGLTSGVGRALTS
nr:MAG TPA: hypothetical protein [Caudoviricetes sp.]